MSFKKKLKYLRKQNNLSAKELADKLMVSKSLISQYESGDRNPSYEMIIKIRDFFNVDFNVLLDEKRDTFYTEEIKGLLTKDEQEIFDIDNLEYIQFAQELVKNEIPLEDLRSALRIIKSAREEFNNENK